MEKRFNSLFHVRKMSIVSCLNSRSASSHRMQTFGGLFDDLLSHCTCTLLYRFRSSGVYAAFGMLWHSWAHLTQSNPGPHEGQFQQTTNIHFATRHIFFYVPRKHQKVGMFSHLLRLSNQSPRSRVACGSRAVRPRLWAAESAEDSVSHLWEAGTHGQSLPLKNREAPSKANGHDFDEFSTNVFCIYITA